MKNQVNLSIENIKKQQTCQRLKKQVCRQVLNILIKGETIA